MTKMFFSDINSDLKIGTDGNLIIISGLHAVLQACEHATKAQLGEMVLSVDNGIPNFQTVWVGSPNVPQFEAAIRVAVLAVPDVLEIISLDTIQVENTLSYILTISTIYGEGTINGRL